MTQPTALAARSYRLDKFIVPYSARAEFLARVKDTHELLRTLPGFVQDFVLEQPSSDDAFVLATLVEWTDVSAVQNAKAAVMEKHQSSGFNAQETIARLGIKVDMGNFKSIYADSV